MLPPNSPQTRPFRPFVEALKEAFVGALPSEDSSYGTYAYMLGQQSVLNSIAGFYNEVSSIISAWCIGTLCRDFESRGQSFDNTFSYSSLAREPKFQRSTWPYLDDALSVNTSILEETLRYTHEHLKVRYSFNCSRPFAYDASARNSIYYNKHELVFRIESRFDKPLTTEFKTPAPDCVIYETMFRLGQRRAVGWIRQYLFD
ncbi:hypothetical protein OMCYN_01658 [cyanobiont of Ornithocercus magnificus]|nr:hypothetical protein OMCYN_01658 [cyanobiont of Ornithocercus magnificus]